MIWDEPWSAVMSSASLAEPSVAPALSDIPEMSTPIQRPKFQPMMFNGVDRAEGFDIERESDKELYR